MFDIVLSFVSDAVCVVLISVWYRAVMCRSQSESANSTLCTSSQIVSVWVELIPYNVD
jgi:hypothetical protein